MPRSPKAGTFWRSIRFFSAGLFIIPCVLGSQILSARLLSFQFSNPLHLAFLTGAFVYLLMHLLLWKPVFIHVMGHELTHAFWAWLLGGKIKSLQVSALGGQVTLSKTNFLISLAPYFFPFYTVWLIPIYFIALPAYRPLVSFLIGFTFSFHLALTLHSLRDRQSDIRQEGVFFSMVFIYLMNLLVFILLLNIVAPEVITFRQFLRRSLVQAAEISGFFARTVSPWFRP